MPLASSARATSPVPQRSVRAGGSIAAPVDVSSSPPTSGGGSSVAEKIAKAQERRLRAEKEAAGKKTPQRSVPVSALDAAKAAAEREAAWRAGAAERAAEVKAMRAAQLADLEREEQAERAREETRRRAEERRQAEAEAAQLRAQAEADARAEAEAKRRAEEEAKDPFRLVWGDGRHEKPGGTASPAGSARGKPLVGMQHIPGASTENGNVLGTRPVVRQSRLYREKESGNAMKAAMGHDSLQWDTEALQGVFQGQHVYDAETDAVHSRRHAPPASTHADAAARAAASPRAASQRPASMDREAATAGRGGSGGGGGGGSSGGGPPGSRQPGLRGQPSARGAKGPGAAPRSASRERGGGRSAAAAAGAGGGGAVAMWIGDPLPDGPSAADEDQSFAPPRTALERMTEVKELLESGLIGQDEYERKRSQILADL